MTVRDVALHSSLGFELRSLQCLLTPMLTLNDLIFNSVFFFRLSKFRLFSYKNVCFSGILLFHLPRMKTKAGAHVQFA